MPLRRRLAPRHALPILVAAALALSACEGDPHAVAWRFAFDPPELGRDSIAIEARIVESACDGETELYRSELRTGAPAAMPTELGPGRYALIGRSRDAECVYHATGCQVVDLPLSDGAEIVVQLRSGTGERACPLAECATGTCVGAIDAGRDLDAGLDGGPPDAGRPDAGPFEVLPSNVGERVPLDATADLDVGTNYWFADTDTGAISVYGDGGVLTARPRAAGTGMIAGIRYEQLPPTTAGAAPLGVFVFQSLRIRAGFSLAGIGSRALVILTVGDAVVEGDLSVSADLGAALRPGAAGGRGGVAMKPTSAPGEGPGGGAGGMHDGSPDGGGGGGGFGSAGGRGGASGSTPATGGASYGDPTCVPLHGGSGGGAGGDSLGGTGGNSGGAVQLTSARGRIVVGAAGSISAHGGAGHGGRADPGGSGGGGGGGSGGAILLEAAEVVIDGRVAANGGGGGSAAPMDSVRGVDGAAGSSEPGSTPAPGGAPGTPNAGGAGSDASGIASAGADAENGGGGGGGAGRIRINTRTGAETYANVSPTTASTLTTIGRATSR